MNKSNQATACSHTWAFVNQTRAFVFQLGKRLSDIRNLHRDVVNSGSTPGEKLPHGRICCQRLQQFHVRVSEGEHSHPHALLSDFFRRVYFQTECVLPKSQSVFQSPCSDTNM